MKTNTFFTVSFKGLGSVTQRELQKRLRIPRDSVSTFFDRRYEIALFDYGKELENLRGIRTNKRLFLLLDRRSINGTYADLKGYKNNPVPKNTIEQGLSILQAWTKDHSLGRTFAVITQADDVIWRKYRRVDLQELVRKMIQHTLPHWKGSSQAKVSFGVYQVGKTILTGLELPVDRQESLDMTEILKEAPSFSLCNTLVMLSRPRANDIVFNPFAADGRIIIERANAGRYKNLLVTATTEGKLEMIKENIGPKHKPIDIFPADPTRLDISSTPNKIMAVLPDRGEQDQKSKYHHFIKQSLEECIAVLKARGRMIIASSEPNFVKPTLLAFKPIRITEQIKNIHTEDNKYDVFVVVKD